MKFVQANEVKSKENYAVLLYGPTGIGKTTAALSAPAPVAHVDFDAGITRVDAAFTPNALIAQIEAWEGYAAMVQELAGVPAKTVVIDTVGKLIDMIQNYVMAQPKYAAKKLEKPTLQVYGDIKVEFVGFIRGLKAGGKNIVFIAQEVETNVKNRKGEDIRYHQPACGSDKNRTEILQDLDLVGYLYKDGTDTRITFDPNESYYGKNTCGIPAVVDIPRVEGAAQNVLLTWVYNLYIQHQQANLDRALYFKQVAELTNLVERIDDAEKANKFCEYAKGVTWQLDAKAKIMAAFTERVTALGLTLKNGVYEKV